MNLTMSGLVYANVAAFAEGDFVQLGAMVKNVPKASMASRVPDRS